MIMPAVFIRQDHQQQQCFLHGHTGHVRQLRERGAVFASTEGQRTPELKRKKRKQIQEEGNLLLQAKGEVPLGKKPPHQCAPELHEVPVILVDALVAEGLPCSLDDRHGPLLTVCRVLQGCPGCLKLALGTDLRGSKGVQLRSGSYSCLDRVCGKRKRCPGCLKVRWMWSCKGARRRRMRSGSYFGLILVCSVLQSGL